MVIFVMSTLANMGKGIPLLTSLGFAVANTAESAVGMWAFITINKDTPDFNKLRHLAALVVAAVFANDVTAFLGAAR